MYVSEVLLNQIETKSVEIIVIYTTVVACKL